MTISDDFRDVDTTEILILMLDDVSIYRIPHMKGAHGYFAADWGVEKDPGIPGRLKITNKSNVLYVHLFHEREECSEAPSLFASCPIRLNPDSSRPDSKLEFFVQGVKDSSRYFACRIVNEKSKKHAYVGIGFQSREVSNLLYDVFFLA